MTKAEKQEKLLYDLLNTTDRKLKVKFKDLYVKIELLIEQGYTDRVILRKLDKEVTKLVNYLQLTTTNAINTAITLSVAKNAELFPKQVVERIAFGLSKELWNEKQNIIEPVKLALKQGLPSRELAKDIVTEINTFHKGQGVYKEPLKNAMRVARTEIVNAYRLTDEHNWNNNPLVVGKEIRLTNSPKKNARCEICVNMAGKYPKGFRWYAFHPMCMCYQIPIIKSETKDNTIYSLPQHAIKYVEANRHRFETWKTPPYWLENFNN